MGSRPARDFRSSPSPAARSRRHLPPGSVGHVPDVERSIILRHHEPPSDYSVPGNWQPAAAATWLVPSDLNLDDPAVNRWLFVLGDWTFYSAPHPVEGKWPDVFRSTAGELVTWMNAQSIRVLIESFHDDTDWVVALGSAR
jgi:hypothetical protein